MASARLLRTPNPEGQPSGSAIGLVCFQFKLTRYPLSPNSGGHADGMTGALLRPFCRIRPAAPRNLEPCVIRACSLPPVPERHAAAVPRPSAVGGADRLSRARAGHGAVTVSTAWLAQPSSFLGTSLRYTCPGACGSGVTISSKEPTGVSAAPKIKARLKLLASGHTQACQGANAPFVSTLGQVSHHHQRLSCEHPFLGVWPRQPAS